MTRRRPSRRSNGRATPPKRNSSRWISTRSRWVRDPHPLRGPLVGEIETEGFGMMAKDMGIECWGLPDLEIRHARDE